MKRLAVLLPLCVALAGADCAAQDARPAPDPHPDATPSAASEDPEPAPEPSTVTTEHRVEVDGRALDYTVEAGTLELTEENGDPKASLFYVAYTKDGELDPAKRPVTFTFNGGPGSSSVWLHMGALGPRMVRMQGEGWAPPPPYEVVPNPHTWLDLTDLVFIDPVTTGYSRAAEGEDPSQFHGVDEDVQWVAEFIRLWTTRNQRWGSPKFLAGESYGTTRAAALSEHLQQRHGMYLNGVVLISAILQFQTARFDEGNDLPYVLFLPTQTATAFYHGRLDEELSVSLRSTLDQAEAFASGPYAAALAKGAALPAAERAEVLAGLSRFTGLSGDFIERCDLRVSIQRFVKELVRDERRTVGRLDSRFQGIDRDAAGERYEYDPSYAAILGPFTGALNDYLRRELEYENDLPYEILTGRVQPWKMGERNSYLNVAEDLRGAMTRNPYLKVFVACGYYDFATPYHAAEYTFDHLGLDPSLAENVTFGYYESGHMMYIRDVSRVRLKDDIAAFYRAALRR